MPLDDLVSELAGGFLRGLVRCLLELFWEGLCRFLGYWTIRILSFGRHQPDEDGWLTAVVALGVLLLVGWGLTRRLW